LINPFSKGSCQFHPGKARERYYFIANNRHKVQRVVLSLWDFESIAVDWQWGRFYRAWTDSAGCGGWGEDATIQDFSIDWQRPSRAQVEVV
jgi:hypothetical protein